MQKNVTMKQYWFHRSPLGSLLLVGHNGILEQLHFPNQKVQHLIADDWIETSAPFTAAILQLDQYFDGTRHEFDVPLAPRGTAFQRNVWQALQNIPFGRTASYSDIATIVGNPKGCRAVGMANAKNPIPIIIPCHRVIGKNGTLTGFGGGIETKQFLLDLEQKYS